MKKDETVTGTAQVCLDGHAKDASTLTFLHTTEGGLTANYLVLLGGPFAGLAGAALIVNRQVAGGTRQKVDASGPSQLRDAIANDNGDGDLIDTQYLMFTGVLLFYFLVNFIPTPSTLPDLPWGLVGLTSGSALAYLANKSVTANGLSVTSLLPSSVTRGGDVHIKGANFTPEGSSTLPDGGITIFVGDTNVTPTSVGNNDIVFKAPGTADSYEVYVTTAADVTGYAGTLTVT